MPSYFITGAGRGIGLALTERLTSDPANVVIASARNPAGSEGLQALKEKIPATQLYLVTLDVVDSAAIAAAVKESETILPNGLDYLILNAGVDLQETKLWTTDVDFDLAAEEFKINVLSPIAILKAFIPLLNKGTAKKVAFFTTILASTTNAHYLPGLADVYSTTKAALNMAVRKAGAYLKASGSQIALLLIHPGWVTDTPLGAALIPWFQKYSPTQPSTTIADSVTGILDVIHTSTLEDSTKFVDYKKQPQTW